MANGILIIDKPQDWTSMDVCAKLRGILQERRIGHGGTLDPMATGVLPVFVGQATRAVEFAEQTGKEYLAGLRLGQVTDTQDTTGTVLETHPVDVTPEALEAALEPFRGDIQQIPPMYSAIKIQGKKLYELARKGVEVERKPRRVTVHTLEPAETLSPAQTPLPITDGQPSPQFYLRVRCSKGTYIRTLCHDLGQALGCGGAMFSLCRTMAAGFSLEQAVSLEAVQSQGDSLLLPTDSLFATYPILPLPSEQAEKRVRCGNPISLPGIPDGVYRIYSRDNRFLCLSRAERGTLTSIKNFFGA